MKKIKGEDLYKAEQVKKAERDKEQFAREIASKSLARDSCKRTLDSALKAHAEAHEKLCELRKMTLEQYLEKREKEIGGMIHPGISFIQPIVSRSYFIDSGDSHGIVTGNGVFK